MNSPFNPREIAARALASGALRIAPQPPQRRLPPKRPPSAKPSRAACLDRNLCIDCHAPAIFYGAKVGYGIRCETHTAAAKRIYIAGVGRGKYRTNAA